MESYLVPAGDGEAEFTEKLEQEHRDNEHGREYRSALALITAHSEIWTPKVAQEAAADQGEHRG